jgi:membrane-bound metal-dependent hydrolase YbcI (DUF457 family)
VAGFDPGWSMLTAAVGAVVPDIDLQWADRWNRPRPGSDCKLLDHRGPTHSVSLAIMVGLAVGFGIAPAVGLMVTVGWLSHLLADAISPMGEPFLWPLSARRYRLLPRRLRIHSGKRLVELPIALVVLGLSLHLAGFTISQL